MWQGVALEMAMHGAWRGRGCSPSCLNFALRAVQASGGRRLESRAGAVRLARRRPGNAEAQDHEGARFVRQGEHLKEDARNSSRAGNDHAWLSGVTLAWRHAHACAFVAGARTTPRSAALVQKPPLSLVHLSLCVHLAESGGRDGAWPKDEGVPGFPAFRTCLWATPQAVAVQFLRQHDGSSHYKALLKGLLKTALETVNAQVIVAALLARELKIHHPLCISSHHTAQSCMPHFDAGQRPACQSDTQGRLLSSTEKQRLAVR